MKAQSYVADGAGRNHSTVGLISNLAYWLLPSLFCWWLYQYGLRTWFLEDDFAWLGLNAQIHDGHSFWHAVFIPSSQGTIRPLSERIFFIVFWRMFGWDAFYYRALVFLTQFFNLILLSWLVRKLTASRLAGFLAPVLWTANASLAVAMSWTSGYNEVLCAAFLLTTLCLFLRFQETGKWRYYWMQMAVFVLGFGVLELNIIYPAIALCWAISRVRTGTVSVKTLALSTLPLFALSAVYYVVHATAASPQSTGPYAMHFDSAVLKTLFSYYRWAFVPPSWADVTGLDRRLGYLAAGILAPGLLIFTIYQALHRRYLPAFFLAWFLITIAPLVPLRDHLSDYYLTIPALGMAVIAATAVERAWHSSAWWKVASVVGLAIYLWVQIPVAKASTLWHYERSIAVRNLVLGVSRAHQLHPDKIILLAGVSPDLYATAVAHRPFRLIPGAQVYLAPQVLTAVNGLPSHLARISDFILPAGATARALEAGSLEVYSAAGSRLNNITGIYEPPDSREYPRSVNVGNPLLAYTLGPSWHQSDGTYRWMGAEATVQMGGPRVVGERLFLHTYVPRPLVAEGPAFVTISIDGQEAGHVAVDKPDAPLDSDFVLPASAVGKDAIEVRIHVNRTFQENDGGRTLSLAFGTLEIR
ncbi:MAG: hypothetical protein JWO80_3381 [Bryobacterales bacterium]|nr:hypothetical protein [Bryobacterales bacterium]